MRLTLIVFILLALSACSTPTQRSAVVPNACVQALGSADQVRDLTVKYLTLTRQHNDNVTAYLGGRTNAADLALSFEEYSTGVEKITPEMLAATKAYQTTSAECRKLANR